jgi:hypothetical protein
MSSWTDSSDEMGLDVLPCDGDAVEGPPVPKLKSFPNIVEGQIRKNWQNRVDGTSGSQYTSHCHRQSKVIREVDGHASACACACRRGGECGM